MSNSLFVHSQCKALDAVGRSKEVATVEQLEATIPNEERPATVQTEAQFWPVVALFSVIVLNRLMFVAFFSCLSESHGKQMGLEVN